MSRALNRFRFQQNFWTRRFAFRGFRNPSGARRLCVNSPDVYWTKKSVIKTFGKDFFKVCKWIIRFGIGLTLGHDYFFPDPAYTLLGQLFGIYFPANIARNSPELIKNLPDYFVTQDLYIMALEHNSDSFYEYQEGYKPKNNEECWTIPKDKINLDVGMKIMFLRPGLYHTLPDSIQSDSCVVDFKTRSRNYVPD